MRSRIWRIAGLIAAAAIVGLLIWLRPDRALGTAASMSAHYVCGAAFIQHVSPEATFRELVQPMASIVGPLITYEVDDHDKSVTASVAGFFTKRAEWTVGCGCRVTHDPRYRSPAAVGPRTRSPADDFAPPSAVETDDAELSAALDRLFAEPAGRHRYVKAVVIVKDGRVVAERYAPGFGVDTPLLSFSVAKSLTNALLGVLVHKGKLRVSDPVGAPEWSAPSDPRGAITIDDLLRMRSGLSAFENGTGFDPSAHMLHLEDDMAGFAARHPLVRPVGSAWDYTSANTLILNRRLGEVVGGGAEGFRKFADEELFQPLHVDGVTLEFDATGVFVGSSHFYAPARSYARLGLLYLNDGLAPDGRRLLPEGWVTYSRKQTLDAPYGAGFWTVDGADERAASLLREGFPRDGFYASGNRGQRIYVIPSQRLVMVRFGYTFPPDVAADMDVLRTAIVRLKARPGSTTQ